MGNPLLARQFETHY